MIIARRTKEINRLPSHSLLHGDLGHQPQGAEGVWGLIPSQHIGGLTTGRTAQGTQKTLACPWPKTFSAVPRAQLQANLQAELLGCHTVHEEGEHLAPHRILAVGTGLRAETRSSEGQVGHTLLSVTTHCHKEPGDSQCGRKGMTSDHAPG